MRVLYYSPLQYLNIPFYVLTNLNIWYDNTIFLFFFLGKYFPLFRVRLKIFGTLNELRKWYPHSHLNKFLIFLHKIINN